MAISWIPFGFWNEGDVAINGEVVLYRGGEFLARPIAVRDCSGDLLGFPAGEVCGAGIEKCADGARRRKKFDVAKQRQLRNRRSAAHALEWRVEGNVNLLRGLRTDALKRHENQAVLRYQVDDSIRARF